jgi:hypothetical protein
MAVTCLIVWRYLIDRSRLSSRINVDLRWSYFRFYSLCSRDREHNLSASKSPSLLPRFHPWRANCLEYPGDFSTTECLILANSWNHQSSTGRKRYSSHRLELARDRRQIPFSFSFFSHVLFFFAWPNSSRQVVIPIASCTFVFCTPNGFDVPHDQVKSRLVRALAGSVELISGDVTENIREMTNLCRKSLDWDVSTIEPFLALARAGNIKEIATEPRDQVIECPRRSEHS